MPSSLKSQQRTLASYSNARQMEVVASLDTAVAEITNHHPRRPEADGGGSGTRRDSEVDAQHEDDNEQGEGGGGEGEGEGEEREGEGGAEGGKWPQQAEEDGAEDMDETVLSRIALETDMVGTRDVGIVRGVSYMSNNKNKSGKCISFGWLFPPPHWCDTSLSNRLKAGMLTLPYTTVVDMLFVFYERAKAGCRSIGGFSFMFFLSAGG